MQNRITMKHQNLQIRTKQFALQVIKFQADRHSRLVRGTKLAASILRSALLTLHSNGAVAGNCTRTSSVAGRHSAIKSQPRKLKGRERHCAARPVPFQQRTNTSCYLAIPTHGFTVVLSVFWGTPPAKPLICKSVLNRLGAHFRQRWTESTGGKPRLSFA